MRSSRKLGRHNPALARQREALNVEKPTFAFDRLVEYTPESVLGELQRVAAHIHPEPLTRAALKNHGRVGISTVRRHFGTWRRAMEAAGIGHTLDSRRPVTPKMTQQQAKGMTDEQMLDMLRTVSGQVSGQSLSTADFNRLAPISAAAVSRRFGGWRVALERAGLDSSGVPRRFSDEECFDNLLNVWTFRG